MSDIENNEVENTSTDEGLTASELLAELAKVRKEAAARRVENRELKATQEELQKYKDAEKTELERLTERANKAEESLAILSQASLKRDVALAAGLEPELADYLKGSTKEELESSAEILASKIKNNTTDLGGGRRGEPIRVQQTAAEAFRSLFN